MAVLTQTDFEEIARYITRKAYRNSKATRGLDEWMAMIEKVDDHMSATTNQAQTAYPSTQNENAFFESVKTGVANATASESAWAVAGWSMRRKGII